VAVLLPDCGRLVHWFVSAQHPFPPSGRLTLELYTRNRRRAAQLNRRRAPPMDRAQKMRRACGAEDGAMAGLGWVVD
jgi:hypothetical protein